MKDFIFILGFILLYIPLAFIEVFSKNKGLDY